MRINTSVDADIERLSPEETAKKYHWTLGEVRLASKLYRSQNIRLGMQYRNKIVQAIWGQVNLLQGDKRVDLIVFTKSCVIVFEVKDSSSEDNEEIQSWTDRNAWIQCNIYVEEIKKISNNIMPVKGVVVLSNISRNSELAEGLRLDEKNHNLTTWFQEDLNRGNINQLIAVVRKKKDTEQFAITDFHPFCALNSIIDEIRISNEVECSDKILLNLLDRDQAKMVFRPTFHGDRIVYGVAGSGKTILIIQKAIQLSKILNKNQKILVVCFNKPLQVFLENSLRPFGRGNIIIRTIQGWHRYVLSLYDNQRHSELKKEMEGDNRIITNDYFETIPTLVNETLIEKEQFLKIGYHSILVDEGQDFDKLWFENLNMVYEKDEKSIFMVCLDGVQNITKRRANKFTWKEVGREVQGRVVYLRKNYRNGKNIAKYAVDRLEVSEQIDSNEVIKELEMKEFGREGGRVQVQELFDPGFIKYIAKVIDNIHSGQTIMIILDNIWGPRKVLEIQDHLQNRDRRLVDGVVKKDIALPLGDIIPVYSVYRSKGLEADHVIYLHTSKSEERQNYVAFTRAREMLYDFNIRFSRKK